MHAPHVDQGPPLAGKDRFLAQPSGRSCVQHSRGLQQASRAPGQKRGDVHPNGTSGRSEACGLYSDILSTRLFLQTVLACVHASIRSGDSQRVDWSCIQLSTHDLHAIAYATKTTRRGQPFACAWHGLSGRDPSSSWVLQWLKALAVRAGLRQPELLVSAYLAREACALTLHSMKSSFSSKRSA